MKVATSSISPYFDQSVIPIYAIDRNEWSQPEHFGTGVLLVSSSRYFLVTAAHVMSERRNRPLHLPATYSIEMCHDVQTSCNLKDDSSERCSIDTCFIELKHGEASAIQCAGFDFLPIHKNWVHDLSSDSEEGRFTLVGYPSFSVSFDHCKRMAEVEPKVIEGLSLVGVKRSERMVKKWSDVHSVGSLVLNCPSMVTINGSCVERPRQKVMRGISGGAIWADFDDGPKMVGIMNAFEESYSVVIGTRIRPVLNVMAGRHPGD